MKQVSSIGLPTLLTLARLILSPLLLPLLLVYLLPYNSLAINSGLACLFLAFGLTDFFDGYLARRLKQETLMGRILDPIADKFLLYAVLITLLTVHKIYFFWVIVFIGREFFVTGLRIMSLEYGFSVPVSSWGKWKTVAQICYLFFIILNPYQQLGMYGAPGWNITQLSLLIGALTLTIISAWQYYQFFQRSMRKNNVVGMV